MHNQTTSHPYLPEPELTDAELAHWEALLPDPEPRRRELLVDPHSLAVNTPELLFAASVEELGRHRNTVSGARLPIAHRHSPYALADPANAYAYEETTLSAQDAEAVVKQLLQALPTVDRMVVRLRWGIGGRPLLQVEVAERLGLDRKTLRGIERHALTVMQHYAAEHWADGEPGAEAVRTDVAMDGSVGPAHRRSVAARSLLRSTPQAAPPKRDAVAA